MQLLMQLLYVAARSRLPLCAAEKVMPLAFKLIVVFVKL